MRTDLALPIILISLSTMNLELRAQESSLPAVPRMSCAAADKLVGKPSHESDGSVEGVYDPRRDSTYLIGYRATKSIRSFLPFVIELLPGKGPFQPEHYLLGFTINSDAEAMKRVTDPMPAQLVLEDFTTFDLGTVSFGALSMFKGESPNVPAMVWLDRRAFLALLHGKSAVVKWGRWHVDLEASDIGTFRAFERTLACAPPSLPEISGAGQFPGIPGIEAPHPTVTDGASAFHFNFGTPVYSEGPSERLKDRISCQRADSLIGFPLAEDQGYLGGRYDPKRDSTYLHLAQRVTSGAGDFNFNTATVLAGPGPFEPRGLGLGLTILGGVSTVTPWSDTMNVTLVLNDSLTLHLGHLHLSQPNEHCCQAPIQVTLVLTRAALLAFLGAERARFSWGNRTIEMDGEEIGMVRAFERALICAPPSLDPKHIARY